MLIDPDSPSFFDLDLDITLASMVVLGLSYLILRVFLEDHFDFDNFWNQYFREI